MYPDLAFSKKYKTQKDRYNLSFKEINLSGVDFISLNNDGNFHAKKIEIGPSKVAVFMNRALPPANFDKGRNYPHVALRRIPFATLIDTLKLNKVDIAYTEFSEKTKERGTLKLDNLSGTIVNLTNDSARLINKNHAYADLTAYFFGTGKMNMKIDFDLTDRNAAFSFVGNIGSFNMIVLNSLSKPLGLVAIEQGKVQKAYFNIKANLKRSSGQVVFYYTGLKVDLLKEDDQGVKKKKGLLSFLANNVLIKNDNPTKGQSVRTANINYKRVPQASFFNLMWKSVFVGIRETVGIGRVPMKEMPEPSSKK
jgi:hypothetical protein